jgi:hypothetical protein
MSAKSQQEINAEHARQKAIHEDRVAMLRRHDATMAQMRRRERASSGSGQCFPSGTMIRTPHGQRDIGSLEAGDLVVALDVGAKESKPRKILRKVGHGNTRLWQICFCDGSALRTTSAHSFLSKNGWMLARRIKEGDVVITITEEMVQEPKVVHISAPTDSCAAVFNLIVEDDFTFIADGVVAHSFTHLRWLRCQLWRLAQSAVRSGAPPLATAQTSTHAG